MLKNVDSREFDVMYCAPKLNTNLETNEDKFEN